MTQEKMTAPSGKGATIALMPRWTGLPNSRTAIPRGWPRPAKLIGDLANIVIGMGGVVAPLVSEQSPPVRPTTRLLTP